MSLRRADGPAQDPEDHEPSRPSTRSALRWTSIALIGKQVFQLIGALLIARILGPSSYGVISVAMIYVTLTTLVLDQGLSAALIQRPALTPKAPGAVVALNLVATVGLSIASYFLAPAIANFFGVHELAGLIQILAIGLVLKALAIVPRAMLSRTLTFKPVAIAEITGAAFGAAAGVTAAFLGADELSLVYQVFTVDAIVALVLLAAARGPVPNLRLNELRPLLSFSVKVFTTNSIAYLSRNADNILVGRFLGVTSLSYYAMAYRVLVIPVQMIGQTVNRVMFPLFSRQSDDRAAVGANLERATGLLALVAMPMALVACAAPQLIHVVLGDAWAPTAPILSVLAIAGARETIFYITPSLMKAMGLATLNLQYEILATAVQIAGIIAGLTFGVLGVAIGYLVAGFALVPVLLAIQKSVAGVSTVTQLRSIWPSVHASLWGATAYLAVSLSPLEQAATLLVGTVAFCAIAFSVLFLVHRRRFLESAADLISIVRPGASK